MVKQNLGKLDRIFRFAIGFWLLGPFAPVFSDVRLAWLFFLIGWIGLIESFIGYCVLHDWFGIDNKDQ